MRALFEDLAFASAHAGVVLHQVGLPATFRRNLWIRFWDNTAALTASFYATRADAYADENTILSTTITMSGFEQTHTVTGGDYNGLALVGTFASVPTGDGALWGYTDSPELVTAENMRTRIVALTAAGQPFEGIGAGNVRIADDYGNVQVPVGIAIVPGPLALSEISQGQVYGATCQINLVVSVDNMATTEDAFIRTREYMNALRSLFGDEQRLSYGECLSLNYVDEEGPVSFPEVGMVADGRVGIMVEYTHLWRDDRFPRN